MKKNLNLLFSVTVAALLAACVTSRDDKPSTSSRVEVPNQGVTIDAKYDSRLDNLIPGYKILTLAVTNNGFDVIKLNPLKDKWEIVDAYGKTRRAINSLRVQNPSLFNRLPGKLQSLIEYPVGVAVGYTETIDVFFPQHQELTAFRSISFYNSERDQKFDVTTNLESPNAQSVISEAEVPPDPRFVKKKKSP